MQQNCVCVGDNAGNVHMLDPHKDFKLVKSYPTGHTNTITEVHMTRGCLITSSTDGTVRISSATDPPKIITTFNSGFGQIASVRIEEVNYRMFRIKRNVPNKRIYV